MQHQTRSPYRVLLIDDDVFSMERHRIMLETWGIVAKCVSNPVDVMTVIDEFKPDLLMIDLNMPLCSGIELAKVIRFHKQWIHIPIIFLSGELDANRQMTALKTGGDEFITKPVVERPFVSMILMRAKRARQLAELMIRDSLTGLLKHTEIKDRLCHELARARRNKTTVSVAMLDIDKFKRINDTYGHPVGDTVIATLAHLLRRALRTTDIVGRYGGEEYMVVMPDSDVANAIRKLDLLRREFEAIGFHHKDLEFHCSFSGGVSDSDSSDKIDLLIEKADMALYRAKTQGRNQILGALSE
jgi:diguanylate cyclase (GGDEF)-like protein